MAGFGVSQPTDALDILHKRKGEFHLVLADIHMPRMSGFELLDIVQKQFRIPVIMISADNSIQAMTKAARRGACSYIVKPVNKSSIQNVGQFVIREQPVNYRRFLEINGSTRKENAEDGNRDRDGKNEDDMIPTKNSRMAWTPALHKIFASAVRKLSDKSGDKNVTPTKILEVMNIKGLTRRNIASHLQKYRLHLKELEVLNQSSGEVLEMRNACHTQGQSQLNYPGVPSGAFQAHETYGHPNTPVNDNSIRQQWQYCTSDFNQQGLNNYAEPQLWNNYGSTQVGDSSNLFMNLNPNPVPVPTMFRVTPEAPLVVENRCQNLEQELNQHVPNNYAELSNYGSTQVGDSSNLFMNSNAIPNMIEPYYQNLGQELYQSGLNSFAEPQLWDNEGVIGVGQTVLNFNDAFNHGITQVGNSSNLFANPNPNPFPNMPQMTTQASPMVERPYQNRGGELDNGFQFTPNTSVDELSYLYSNIGGNQQDN